ncbi:MAG: hypothetical protein Q9216_003230 [Gyalolechia sp. 2 TL-2023]
MGSEQFSTKESNTLLNKDPFRNEDTQRLFEAIDELRSCGANHDIELPELVIVGDQSTGKSSLLQSLTDIPFPVDERLCTRFPTRIVSRRTPNEVETTKISIEPASNDRTFGLNLDESSDSRRMRSQAYAEFADSHQSSSGITTNDFRTAIKDAKKAMGITGDEWPEEGIRATGGRRFASDILKVELSGPYRSHFSILDVPGVFQFATEGVTEIEKDGVRNMVASYMKPQQSVIICVATATHDLACQAAFDMASRYDPQLQRTIGVITKCDITQHKKGVVSLAQNKEKKLFHGWFVVRNRTPEELEHNISNLERQKREEDFFEVKPWNALPESRRGTQALKNFLADLLCHRIQEVFPSILATIKERQEWISHQLERLGPSRTTTEEKRTYLTDVAQQLHSLNSQALRGRYHGLMSESLKLRRLVVEANDTFTAKMIKHGHSVSFQDTPIYRDDTLVDEGPKVGNKSAKEPSKSAATSGTSTGGGLLGNSNKPTFSFGASPAIPTSSLFGNYNTQPTSTGSNLFGNNNTQPAPAGFGAFDGFAQAKAATATAPSSGTQSAESTGGSLFGKPADSAAPAPQPPGGIYAWIKEEIKNCRGTELQGTLNPDVLPALFHRQIVRWKEIAATHFQSVAKVTTLTLERAVFATCGNEFTAQQILTLFRRTNKIGEEHGLLQIQERFKEITSRHLQTQNPIFEKNIRNARLTRFKAALQRYHRNHTTPSIVGASKPEANEIVLHLLEVTSLFDELHMSNTQNLEDEIHDTLKSYYELALHDFIEYVTQQVVESYLNDPKGPVLFFNPMYIGTLTAGDIDTLGGEDPDTAKARLGKAEALTRLERAEKIALKYTEASI